MLIKTEHHREDLNVSLFLYQKYSASLPNYIAINRGTEGAVFLRYIIDHYHDLPDFIVFIHAYVSCTFDFFIAFRR